MAVALTFAAIEAVIGDRETSVARTLSFRLPAALQRDAGKRRDLARLAKRLYEVRCGVVHGSELESPTNARALARTLLANLLHAAASWHEANVASTADSRGGGGFVSAVEQSAAQERPFPYAPPLDQEKLLAAGT